MEQDKRFKMIDENFICEVCGSKVEKLGYTARDHCPYCLSSKHVDINPGDRENKCQGLMKPVAIEKYKNGETDKLYYKIINEKYGIYQIDINQPLSSDHYAYELFLNYYELPLDTEFEFVDEKEVVR